MKTRSRPRLLKALCCVLVPVQLGLSAQVACSADLERGRALHDTHCRMCHDSSVYQRERKVTPTYEEVRQEVVRWQKSTSLRWSEQDVDNVTAYLVKAFYKIPCAAC